MAPIVFKPVVDSYASKPFIEVDPLTAIYERHFNQVPIIIGANEHEGVIFTDPLAKPELLKQLQDDWENKFPLLALNRYISHHCEYLDFWVIYFSPSVYSIILDFSP